MNAELIDMTLYEYAGEGANGASYNHVTDRDIMVKLYNPGMDRELVEAEVDIARRVFDAGIPSPEPGAFVTDGAGRYGIRFRRLQKKVSFARAIGQNPHKVESYARRFARMCLRLHGTQVDPELFPSVKEQYLTMLDENPFYNAEEKAKLHDIIVNTPDTVTAIHGDLQFGNLLDVEGESYFIDLGEFAYGHPYFDLGMVLITTVYNDEAFTEEFFHMKNQTALEFWKYFSDEYFGGTLTASQAESLIRPYAAVKNLLIERNSNCKLEIFHKLLD